MWEYNDGNLLDNIKPGGKVCSNQINISNLDGLYLVQGKGENAYGRKTGERVTDEKVVGLLLSMNRKIRNMPTMASRL